MNFVLSLFLFITYSLNTETVFYTDGTVGPYKISDRAILVATDSLFINDSLISHDQYMIDYNQGTITFKDAIAESLSVRVRYRELPFVDNNTKYYTNVLKTAPLNDTTSFSNEIKIVKTDTREREVQDLDFSGSKTISIDFGSKQSLGLEQATRINLKGNLEGVNVSAILSDVGNPIPPEGTTKELSEFDKILIKVSTDKFTGAYGDNDLSVPFEELGTINKKITGVLFNTYLNKNIANIGYAKSKGKYIKLIFYGKDSKQGPYYLTKDLKNASIVPGTENVYLQGKRINRGETEDYTIDYSQGALTFTNRQIISSFSRIEIDFEYMTEEYNRYITFVNDKWQRANGLILNGGFYSEADDKSQNLSYDLTEQEISYLSTIPAESNQVWISGIKYVGAGYGDYVALDSYYVYAGLDLGDYDVKFTYVGAGYGEYDYDNLLGGFSYIGLNQGKYITKVLIHLPEQNRIYDAHVKWELPLGVNFGASGFLSQRKRNLFANLNQNRDGYSYQLNMGYEKERFKLLYCRTEQDSRFYFPGSYKDFDFGFYWAGIKQESLRYSDEIKLQVKPADFLLLDGSSGWLKSFANDSRQRYTLGGRVMLPADNTFTDWKLEYYPNRIRRFDINLTPAYRIFYPAVQLFYEKQGNWISRYLVPSFKIKLNDEIEIKISSEIKEHKFQTRKINQVYKWEGNFSKSYLSLQSMLGYQINKIDNMVENDNLFGNVTGQVTALPGLNVSVDYSQQQGEIQTNEINYVWVGVGLGNYKRNPETRQFYYDPQGDYIQQYIPSGNFITSVARKLQTNWDFYRWELLNFDGYYSIDDQKSATNSLQNRCSQQLNLSILPYEKDLSIRLSNSNDLSKDNQYNSGATKRSYNNNRLEVQSQRIENIPIKLTIELNDNMTERINQGVEQQNREYIYKFSPSIGYYLNLEIDVSYSRQENVRPLYYPELGKFWLYKLKLDFKRNWEIRKSTNLITNIILTRRTATISSLPFDINLYEPIGITPEIKVSLDRVLQPKVNRTFNQLVLNMNYIFLKYPNRTVEHTLTTKIQANF